MKEKIQPGLKMEVSKCVEKQNRLGPLKNISNLPLRETPNPETSRVREGLRARLGGLTGKPPDYGSSSSGPIDDEIRPNLPRSRDRSPERLPATRLGD